MKIYTYYQNINNNTNNIDQEKMIELWKVSWKKAGFDPVVLCLGDAKSHSFYNFFIEQIKDLHIKIMNKPISEYGLSCYVRWLAYATRDIDNFYVSDYDCINNGLRPKKPITEDNFEEKTNKLYLMDHACPCFAFSSKYNFTELCKNFIEISSMRLEEIKKIKNNSPCYHDQEFFYYNFDQKFNKETNSLIQKHNIALTRDRNYGVGPYETNKKNTCQVLHISHHNANIIQKSQENFKEKNINEIRLIIIEKILNSNNTIF